MPHSSTRQPSGSSARRERGPNRRCRNGAGLGMKERAAALPASAGVGEYPQWERALPAASRAQRRGSRPRWLAASRGTRSPRKAAMRPTRDAPTGETEARPYSVRERPEGMLRARSMLRRSTISARSRSSETPSRSMIAHVTGSPSRSSSPGSTPGSEKGSRRGSRRGGGDIALACDVMRNGRGSRVNPNALPPHNAAQLGLRPTDFLPRHGRVPHDRAEFLLLQRDGSATCRRLAPFDWCSGRPGPLRAETATASDRPSPTSPLQQIL